MTGNWKSLLLVLLFIGGAYTSSFAAIVLAYDFGGSFGVLVFALAIAIMAGAAYLIFRDGFRASLAFANRPVRWTAYILIGSTVPFELFSASLITVSLIESWPDVDSYFVWKGALHGLWAFVHVFLIVIVYRWSNRLTLGKSS